MDEPLSEPPGRQYASPRGPRIIALGVILAVAGAIAVASVLQHTVDLRVLDALFVLVLGALGDLVGLIVIAFGIVRTIEDRRPAGLMDRPPS